MPRLLAELPAIFFAFNGPAHSASRVGAAKRREDTPPRVEKGQRPTVRTQKEQRAYLIHMSTFRQKNGHTSTSKPGLNKCGLSKGNLHLNHVELR